MKTCVVDASVIGAAHLREDYTDVAKELLAVTANLYAPDIIDAEFANALWKRHRRGEMEANEAQQLLKEVAFLPLRIVSCLELASEALEIAIDTGRTVYDSLYLALAIQQKVKLITADKRFVNALAKSPYAKHIEWLGSL
ncbi:MAG: type II toxin-antitoxin system VapC family toxin [Pirellulales bacterium]